LENDAPSLKDDRRIRQFVADISSVGRMAGEQISRCFDAGDRAFGEAPGSEMLLHHPAARFPFGLRYTTAGDAAIRDDFNVAVSQQHIDQHAVAVLGIPDPILREQVDRAIARRQAGQHVGRRKTGFDDEADFARVTRLAARNGSLNLRQN